MLFVAFQMSIYMHVFGAVCLCVYLFVSRITEKLLAQLLSVAWARK